MQYRFREVSPRAVSLLKNGWQFSILFGIDCQHGNASGSAGGGGGGWLDDVGGGQLPVLGMVDIHSGDRNRCSSF